MYSCHDLANASTRSVYQHISMYWLIIYQLRQLLALLLCSNAFILVNPCVCCPAGIHSFADMYSCRDLENASRRFVYQHFQEVIGTEEFFLLAEADVVDLLRSDQLQVCLKCLPKNYFFHINWASKETYHFFRVTFTEIHCIKMIHIWTNIR